MQTVFIMGPIVGNHRMNYIQLVIQCYHRWCMTPNSSSPPFELARNAKRNGATIRYDTIRCVVATRKCYEFWAKATFWKNFWKGINNLYAVFFECALSTPINSNASPHLATGNGFVNWSNLWDVVLMYSHFIISSSLKHS